MRLKNYTQFSTEKLREIIRFAAPPRVHGYDIIVKNTKRGSRGRAYANGCYLHNRYCPLVTIHLSFSTRFPFHWRGGNGYLPIDVYSQEEVVVVLIAHELRHLWQKVVPRGHRVWGARGRYSERDADAYAIHILREWRRHIPARAPTGRIVTVAARAAA